MTKANLIIDLNECFIVFEHTDSNRTDVEYENFLFQEVQEVNSSAFVVDEADSQGAMVPIDFKLSCYKVKFRQKGVKLIACANEQDQHHWIRTFRLIA